MNRYQLTEAHEQCLREQVITDDQPGPILRDFQMLLEFVGPEGVEVGGKLDLLPIKFIGELDQRLSRPLRLQMKRPQIRSHPYLQGLNLLLRASGLTRVDRGGKKARLVLNPAMMVQWDQLNPTERYFNLLEAWFRFGRSEMVGEQDRFLGGMLWPCLQTWQEIPEKGHRFDLKKPNYVFMRGISRDFYLLALMDLFGLLEVEHPSQPVTPWCPAAVKHVPFGDAFFTLIGVSGLDKPGGFDHLILGTFPPPDDDFLEEEEFEEEDDEDQEEEEWEEPVPQFGVWQPVFQPYFPEWQANLEVPRIEPREGEFVFRVSLGKTWRRIAIPAEATLDDLVYCILDSVDFDSDHLYEFTYRNQVGAEVSAFHPFMDEGPSTSEVRIGTLPLEPGQAMQLTYDFGDNWQFDVKLERVDPPGPTKSKGPRILESHGKAPEQYPSWDDDFEDDPDELDD